MSNDIHERLKETSQKCLDVYIVWEENKQDPKTQEVLHAAIHELRKVSSRLEIELAMSERDQFTAKPLPIPSHRSNMKHDGGSLMEGVENAGKSGRLSPVVQNKNKRRRMPRKKPDSNSSE